MQIKVETEKKYYCIEPELLSKRAEELNFKQTIKVLETDEYFTDINSEYIVNRTCLRIRKQDDKTMEITFKGKSSSLLGQYCKLENNIACSIEEYKNFVNLFSSLGYYSYVTVEKERIVYELQTPKYIYNIMIDNLLGIGGFVEFEIISEKGDSTKTELKKELNNFILRFKDLNLKEANEPYRDIVAKHFYNSIVKSKKASKLYINVDEEILRYEKDFLEKYEEKISSICNEKINWESYKKNKHIDNKIVTLIDEYLDNLIFDSKELLVMAELLNKLTYANCFITKVNKTFFDKIFDKLSILHNDVLYMKEESINQLFKKSINMEESIILTNKNLKEINSSLLIIKNNEK